MAFYPRNEMAGRAGLQSGPSDRPIEELAGDSGAMTMD